MTEFDVAAMGTRLKDILTTAHSFGISTIELVSRMLDGAEAFLKKEEEERIEYNRWCEEHWAEIDYENHKQMEDERF